MFVSPFSYSILHIRLPFSFLRKTERYGIYPLNTYRFPYMSKFLQIPYRFLHSYGDGSELIAISARWLLRCPPWEGQRTIDTNHVRKLSKTIQHAKELEGPYTVAVIPPEHSIIGDMSDLPRISIVDGQHRAEVLREWFLTQPQSYDFMVVVRLVTCTNDMMVIDLFRKINTVKPMQYEMSPEEKQHELVKLLCANYQRKDTGHKLTEMIRTGAKQRPFLATELLLNELRVRRFFHPESASATMTPQEVADAIQAWNVEQVADPDAYIRTVKGITPAMKAKAIMYNFFLGLDPRLQWLSALRVT